MTDEDRYVLARDFLVASTGTWSANSVYAVATAIGLRGTRAVMLAAIKNACGESGKRGGPKASLTGTEIAPRTSTRTSTREKEKEPKRKRETFYPGETASLLAPFGLGSATEAVTETLVYLTARSSRGMTVQQASTAAQRASAVVLAHGAERASQALRYAMSRGVDGPVEYAAACCKRDARTGTGSQPQLVSLTGTARARKPMSAEQQRMLDAMDAEG